MKKLAFAHLVLMVAMCFSLAMAISDTLTRTMRGRGNSARTHSAQPYSAQPYSASPRFREQAINRAVGRGNPLINLSDGHEVITSYLGSEESVQALERNEARGLSLASADFDEDGVPDLISGYAGPTGGGIVTLLRGNVDSIYPNAPGAKERRAAGTFTDAPFLSPAFAFGVPEAADFIGAGDFDGDSHWDVVTAARGSNKLYLMSGDGKGGLRQTKRIDLPDGVTAMVVGEINRRDGLDDIVVGISGEHGPKALVFESPEGALRANPEVFDLPAEATSLALGQLDDSYEMDLAVAAGRDLIIVHGRDRKLSLDLEEQAKVPRAVIEKRSFPFVIRSISAGQFTGNQRTDIALLSEEGEVSLLSEGVAGLKEQRSLTGIGQWNRKVLTRGQWSISTQLIRVRVSSSGADDLLVVDSRSHRLEVLKDTVEAGALAGGRAGASRLGVASAVLVVDGEPQMVLPMRLNFDALNDLVILKSGSSVATVVMTQPQSTFTVINTNDTGTGSLRQAILDANANPGADMIVFNIPGPGPYTISPTSPLPTIGGSLSESAIIDGTTQPGYAGTPVIELNGANAGSESGLVISSAMNVVRGLVINRFAGTAQAPLSGIRMEACGGPGCSVADYRNIIEGNFIGTDVTGTINLGCTRVNAFATTGHTIGGTTPAARNVISGGIDLFADSPLLSSAVVQGNFIGTDVTGSVGLGCNSGNGVFVSIRCFGTIGGTTAGARNVLSGKSRGVVFFESTSNLLQGNLIGTDVSGTAALGNSTGVHIVVTGATIGGTTAAARNIISGNVAGIFFDDSGGLVQGNFIGTNIDGTAPLSNGTGVSRNSSFFNRSVSIGGTVIGARNLISGNTQSGVFVLGEGVTVLGNYIGTDVTGLNSLGNSLGVFISGGSNNTIGGVVPEARNVISANVSGVVIQGGTGNFVRGNYIGTDETGTADLGNSGDGLEVSGAGNVIGGTTSGARNIISGNDGDGVQLAGSGNLIQGNYIGTDVVGALDLGNKQDGIELFGGNNSNNSVGGSTAEARNVISGNGGHGVHLNGSGVSGITVTGNYIGTTADGTGAMGNGSDGVRANLAFNNTIGGVNAAERNVISSNGGKGIYSVGAGLMGNTVQGNYIGTDATGTIGLGNHEDGIFVSGRNNTIGGATPGAGNIISGNNGSGIFITGTSSSGNILQSNLIGTDVNGTGALGNSGSGLRIANSPINTIGGTATGAGNVIAFNGASGVLIYGASAIGNAIRQNYIFSNTGLGIDLEADGVTANDAGDSDMGANSLQNFPVVTSATLTTTNTIIQGTLNSTANSTFTIEFFSNSACDASGNGEGATFIGSTSVTTKGSGNASFNVTLATLAAGQEITATTTDGSGNTSEFSACALVVCSYQISPNSAFFPVTGSEALFSLATAPGCSWTANSNDSWIEITSENTGSGNATISYIVGDNFSPVPRQGTITIAGLTFTVTQDSETAPDCTYNIFPLFESHPAAGGSGSINVVTDERCAWQAVSNVSWITITSGCCAIGNGSVTYSVPSNPGTSGRAGTITIADRSFKVKQKGK